MKQLINKCVRWFSRRWHKTTRGKWHVATRWYSLRKEFVPACCPRAVWKTTATKKHAPPKGEVVCKICAALEATKELKKSFKPQEPSYRLSPVEWSFFERKKLSKIDKIKTYLKED